LIFAIFVYIVFTRQLMDIARKKYIEAEEGVYAA